MNSSNQKNADRFTGFADIYDNSRPSVPQYPVEIIKRYLGKQPETVVDLGCGTGLSTAVWSGNCKNAIGIEPSDDMRLIANKKSNASLKFIKGFSDCTNLCDNCADVVVCSQSFHWMEPTSTLKEVNRILKDGGVFATIDCDWPPVTLWQAEKEFKDIYSKVQRLERELPNTKDSFVKYDKNKHLSNIADSGYFRYSREIVFSNTEKCNADRLINLLMSQGSVQGIIKKYPEMITDDINYFSSNIKKLFSDSNFDIDFSYRMRIAVK